MTDNVITTNRQARFNYTILESFEAGIALKGVEVKSLRTAKASLADSFARIDNGEVFLYNMYVSPYEFGNRENADPMLPRKLLLHKSQIRRLAGELGAKGLALIPLKLYFKNGMVKVELAVGKGKKMYDKRQTIKKRESDRELRRISRHRG